MASVGATLATMLLHPANTIGALDVMSAITIVPNAIVFVVFTVAAWIMKKNPPHEIIGGVIGIIHNLEIFYNSC